MFKQLAITEARSVVIDVDGRPVRAGAGESVAAALLIAGCVPLRHTPLSGAPRAPVCMMGVCFECLVEIDDQPNVQACMVSVRDGMRIRTQHAARKAEA
ncbi:MAG TPA: (2Fe-2S)-binding protein [Vicinamibacterales bacterium]|nr:(2Fe-2S)-binding protein [Vicinamibacterales bacterium]